MPAGPSPSSLAVQPARRAPRRAEALLTVGAAVLPQAQYRSHQARRRLRRQQVWTLPPSQWSPNPPTFTHRPGQPGSSYLGHAVRHLSTAPSRHNGAVGEGCRGPISAQHRHRGCSTQRTKPKPRVGDPRGLSKRDMSLGLRVAKLITHRLAPLRLLRYRATFAVCSDAPTSPCISGCRRPDNDPYNYTPQIGVACNP